MASRETYTPLDALEGKLDQVSISGVQDTDANKGMA